ncbi:uncharacterized protein [Dermacentor albipictus]|uniref:uncharacterized protein n=1 Tax=Dermacentor albipictus TaxID=60249 RepID=UPI0038FCA205
MASTSSRTSKCGNVPLHADTRYKKSSGHHCVVFGCRNNQRKRSRLLSTVCEDHNTRRESCRCGVFSLHRFPSARKNAKLRHQWIAAVNRKNYQPSENARVCSEHFPDNQPTEQNPVPMLRLGYNKKVVNSRRLLIRQAVSPVSRPRQLVAKRGQRSSDHGDPDETESAEDNVLRAGGNLGTLHADTQALAAAGPEQEQQIVQQQGQTSQQADHKPEALMSFCEVVLTYESYSSGTGSTTVTIHQIAEQDEPLTPH